MFEHFDRDVGGRSLSIEMGRVARQANGAVTVRYGETVVLVTACASPEPREGIDFVPLTIDFEERLYAAGKIPGGFFRREGRPTQDAILTMRLTDRPLRPLFPKGYRHETQVIVTVLSADRENDPDLLSIIGASAALGISDIPFNGPVGVTRVGYSNGEFIINPTFTQLATSRLDLVVAGTKDAVIMVEAGVAQVPEDVVIEALRLGQAVNQDLAEFQGEIIRVHGKPKLAFEPPQPNRELESAVAAILKDGLGETLAQASKSEREGGLDQLRRQVVEALKDAYPEGVILAAIEGQIKSFVRSRILEQGRRPDGRGLTDIRPISSEVGILPRTHGSGLFTRGETQVLTIATLGSLGEVQKLDGISPEETRRFMHHYNMPPFSNGEVKRIGTPGRREIGHGALVERALAPVIPNEAEFPYTIRLVSEVLSSNGSTSMASVCGSSLSLMDAGVPIKAPVAGAAMGLVLGEGGKHAILTDIIGMEDFLGDMDFKVAGTAQGITALQMDMKVKGITYDIIVKALEQARTARLFILDRMKEAIAAPRPQLNKYAPRMIRLSVDPDKIRTVIGPGGKTIRSIIQQYGVTVDVEDDGTVVVGAISEESAKGAIKTIEDLTRDVEVGSIYTGKVTRLMNFGAFVEILPGKEGLVHVSELAEFQVANPEEVVKVGDEVMVMVIEIDRMGRVNLSRRAVLEGRTSPPTDRVGAGDRGPQGGPPPRRFEERRPGPPGEGRFDRERRPGGPYRPQGRGGPPGGFGGRPQPRG